jgi:hypothetical protein
MRARLLLPTVLLAVACGGTPGGPGAGGGTDDAGSDGGAAGGTDDCEEVTVYDDLDGDGFGDPDTARLGCADDRGVVFNGDDCLDTDPRVFPLNPEICINDIDEDCDGVADDGCHVEWCGVIEEDTVWEGRFVHDLTCDVFVEGEAAPTLTIEDGAQVLADEDVTLKVGDNAPGSLSIEGGDVGLFLDSSDPQTPWRGIYLDHQTVSARIDRAFIRDAVMPLYINAAEVDVTGTTIERARTTGITMRNATRLRMSGSTIRDGERHAITGYEDACLDGTATFRDNVIVGNAGAPIRVPAQCYRALDASSSYTGNGDDTIYVLDSYFGTGNVVTGEHHWQDLGVPVVGDMSYWMQADETASLILDGGLDLTWRGSYAGFRHFGSIVADGSTERISIHGGDLIADDGELVGVDFDTPRRVWMGRGGLRDVSLYRPLDPVQADSLVGVDITDCLDVGLELEDTFHHMDDVTVTGCGGIPADLRPGAVPHLDPDSRFTGNAEDWFVVRHASVNTDITIDGHVVWPAMDVPYWVVEDVIIEASSSTGSASLTLSDGLEIMAGGTIEEHPVGTTGRSNSLIVDGHTQGVRISGGGLVLGFGDDTRIEGLHYTGGNPTLDLRNPGVYIRDTTITEFRDYAIWGHVPDMQGSTVQSPARTDSVGLLFWDEDTSAFTGNTFTDTPNIGYVYMDAVAPVLANNDMSAVTGGTVRVRGTLTASATWTADFSYTGEAVIGSGADLTLEPGVEWAGRRTIETASGGTLTAIGTESAPIVFTSASATPAAANWHGLTLRGGSTLEHVELRYAGGYDSSREPSQVGIELLGPATIRDTTISDTSGWCISRANTAAQSATIEDVSYSCTSGGLY